MAFSTGGGIATIPLLKGGNKELLVQLKNCSGYGGQSRRQVIKANLREDEAPSPSPSPSSSSSVSTAENTKGGLGIGSPIVVIEAPKMIKTAAAVPCLRANAGLVNPGDVGRIVSRKPKDVWAVRLSIGTYLIDGKYFKPLDLTE